MDQGQFSDPDLISGTHQREKVQFADKCFLVTKNTNNSSQDSSNLLRYLLPIFYLQPFPHREYGEDDMCKTVEELGLTPSGSLVLQKKEIKQAVAETTGNQELGLTPSGSLVLQKKDIKQAVGETTGNQELDLTPSGSLVLQKKEIKQAVGEATGNQELGLTPSGSLVLQKKEIKQAVEETTGNQHIYIFCELIFFKLA